MKKINVILGIIVFIAPWFLYKAKLRELRVEKQGVVVYMKIIQKPSSCLGTKVKWSMRGEYKEKIYFTQIGGQYCEEHKIEDIVPIKYLEGSDIIFI